MSDLTVKQWMSGTEKDLVVATIEGVERRLIYFTKNENEDGITVYGESSEDVDDDVSEWSIEEFITMALENAPIPMYSHGGKGVVIKIL